MLAFRAVFPPHSSIDPSPAFCKVSRHISVDGFTATLHVEAVDERTMRLCVSSCMESAQVAIAVLNEFSAPLPVLSAVARPYL
jgi:tRNA threonylcarbamoyladenosine modification (KEOPS) complex  Pcc1 subunit